MHPSDTEWRVAPHAFVMDPRPRRHMGVCRRLQCATSSSPVLAASDERTTAVFGLDGLFFFLSKGPLGAVAYMYVPSFPVLSTFDPTYPLPPRLDGNSLLLPLPRAV
jgi:hypothetical protein